MTKPILQGVVITGLTVAVTSSAFAEDKITLTDQRDVTVELDGPVERLVTFPMPAAALFASVAGSAEPLVAMHPASQAAIEEGILGVIFPEALDVETGITSGGVFAPNVEAVLNLKPDLVVQWAGRGDELLEPMEAVGLPVIGLTYGTQEDTETWIRTLAAAIDQPDRADLILGKHEDAIQRIGAQAAEVPDDERVSVLYFLRAANSLEVRGEGSYNHFYMDMVGGVNPAGPSGSRTEINPEQLLAWNPDVILLGNFDPAMPEDFYNNPLYSALNAVQNRRVYKMPLGGYRWDPPSQESPLSWMWLAELLYGDRMDYDLRWEMQRFYADVYGYELSDSEIDAILRIDVNGENPGYDRFLRQQG
ncbi:MAG: ABC transporter substrate-binding protein [Hyphomonas sp.]|nr:ABC transporter substrate-binding protein [Hyphomonas sp.]